MEDGVVGSHFQKVTLRKSVYMMSSQKILTTGSKQKQSDAVVKTTVMLMAVLLGIQIESYPTYTL